MVYDPSQDGSDMDAATWVAMREALSVIVSNAIIGPDAYMGGVTDCYHVPIEDIEAARAALKLAGVKS